MLLSLIHITVIDVIDILIVAFLLYKLYQLIKGTAAMKIFFGIAIIYFVWLLVKALKMELLESIMGQVIGVGVIVLIIVFQQEVRQFLLMLGDKYLKRGALIGKVKLINDFSHDGVESIVQASVEMAETKTGALIVIARETSLQTIIQTGEKLNADINTQLIKAIFYKNAPLHDGAMVIEKNKIDIFDIPIAIITEQYLEYISQMQEADMDISSDFLVMAATLCCLTSLSVGLDVTNKLNRCCMLTPGNDMYAIAEFSLLS